MKTPGVLVGSGTAELEVVGRNSRGGPDRLGGVITPGPLISQPKGAILGIGIVRRDCHTATKTSKSSPTTIVSGGLTITWTGALPLVVVGSSRTGHRVREGNVIDVATDHTFRRSLNESRMRTVPFSFSKTVVR